jgi:hypothetical protein
LTEQNKILSLGKTIGDVVPENVMIFIDKEELFFGKCWASVSFRFANPTVVSFHLREANKVISKTMNC